MLRIIQGVYVIDKLRVVGVMKNKPRGDNQGVSCFLFNYTICTFIIYFFTNVGLVSAVCLLISRAKQMIRFRNDTKN